MWATAEVSKGQNLEGMAGAKAAVQDLTLVSLSLPAGIWDPL